MAESNPQQQDKYRIVLLSESDLEIIKQHTTQTSLDMKEILRQSEKFANTTIKDIKESFGIIGNNKNVHPVNKSNDIETINQQLQAKCDEYNQLQKRFDIISKENTIYKQHINQIKEILVKIYE